MELRLSKHNAAQLQRLRLRKEQLRRRQEYKRVLKEPFPRSWDQLTGMARWSVSGTLCHTGAAPSPSARCCGSVSSNRNASSVNGELERLRMRAELRSWRFIVDKIRDQGAPVQDMLEEVWSLGLCRALWCSQTRCTPFISFFGQETGA